jgi:hypothetical protein
LSAPELSTWIDERVPPLKRPKLVVSGTVKVASALDCGSPAFRARVFRLQPKNVAIFRRAATSQIHKRANHLRVNNFGFTITNNRSTSNKLAE